MECRISFQASCEACHQYYALLGDTMELAAVIDRQTNANQYAIIYVLDEFGSIRQQQAMIDVQSSMLRTSNRKKETGSWMSRGVVL